VTAEDAVAITGDPAGQIGHRVQVRDAVKAYGSEPVLRNIEFDIAPGEFMVLLGPSGSGKSTLIRSLAGIERLDGGEIHLSGELASARHRHLPPERRNLAMVFQDYALWPHLTVAENVGYALRRRHLDRPHRRLRIRTVLERVGLAAHADRYPHELSGGEQQRVALARAVVAEPALLLFDEPLSNLDADLRERLRVEIATVTRETGATAVYITHDQSEAFALADKVGVLDRGSLVQLDRPEAVYRSPVTPFVARFTGVAGELAGRAVHHVDDYTLVQVGDTALQAKTVGELAIGDAARILIRPAASRIVDLPLPGEPSQHALPATVIDVAYRGRGYDHVVTIGPHRVASVHHDDRAYRRGDKIAIGLDADHMLALRDDSPLV
jgi:iron(III) transport system ATP-binding protein